MKIFNLYRKMNVVAKASIWFIAVTVIDKAISIITQPFINRLLSVEEVGVYGVFSSWLSIMTVLATFNLFCGVLEVLLTKEPDNKKKIVSSLTLLCIIINIVFGILVLVFMNPLSSILSLKPSYIIVMILTILANSVIQFWGVPKRFEYSYKKYALITLILVLFKGLCSVLFTYLFVEDRLLGRILGFLLPSFLLAIPLFVSIIKSFSFGTIKTYWFKAIKFNLPLIPHYLANILLSSSDRIMIEKLDSTFNSGLYSLAYSYASLTLIIFTAINSAYTPYSMKCIKEEKYEELSKTTNIMLIISLLFSLLIIAFAPEGIYILGGKAYLTTLNLIPTLVLGIFFSSFYFIFSNVEFVYEKNKFIFPITLFGTLINIVLNYIFIPIFGYEVAALTTLIGYVIIFVLHYIVSYSIIKKDIFNIKKILLELFVFIVLVIAINLMYNFHFLFRYVAVIMLLIVILICLIKYGKIYFNSRKNNN